MEREKHIPALPWDYTEDEKAEMFSIHTENTDPIDGPNEFIACGIWYQSVGRDNGKAIAELIVNSVNNAPALLEQVEKLKKELDFAGEALIKGSNVYSKDVGKLQSEVGKLKAREKELIEYLEWNVSSILNSNASRDAKIRLEIYRSLLTRIKQTT